MKRLLTNLHVIRMILAGRAYCAIIDETKYGRGVSWTVNANTSLMGHAMMLKVAEKLVVELDGRLKQAAAEAGEIRGVKQLLRDLDKALKNG